MKDNIGMDRKHRFNLVLIICAFQIAVYKCQRQVPNISISELSHMIFSKPFNDNIATAIQINRGARLPSTRIFYSSMANTLNQKSSIVHPTFPSNGPKNQGNRRRKASRKPTKTNKFCLTCLTDFKTKIYNINDACLNPLRNVTEAGLRFLNMCPETSRFCQTEIYTVNGVLSGLERRCSFLCQDKLCFQRSYGTETNSCSYCCPMLDENNIDEESISKCPM